jgi:hypothetical protein
LNVCGGAGGWGDDLWRDGHLFNATVSGLTNETVITKAVERTLLHRMRMGLMDAPENNPWTRLNLSDMNSTHSQQVAHEAALQSFVLLKNVGQALPLKLGSKIACVGPLADPHGPGNMDGPQKAYISDYAGAGQPADMPSIADAIQALNAQHGGTTTRAAGVGLDGRSKVNESEVASALSLVADADATVLVVGITKDQEHEGVDRTDTLLPAIQSNFSRQVFATALAKGTPVVLVLISGGILSIDELIDGASAIVDAFNPAQAGPPALASTLFGLENRFGKLPVTVYSADYAKQQPIQEMSLTETSWNGTTKPGRSYRWYRGTKLWEFGFGLSYTNFSLSCAAVAGPGSDEALHFSCTVKNLGTVRGDEVVLCFHTVSSAIRSAAKHPVPIKKLVGFERSSLAPSQANTLDFAIPKAQLALVDNTGASVLYQGAHTLTFSRGHGANVSLPVVISAAEAFKHPVIGPPSTVGAAVARPYIVSTTTGS